MSLTVEHSRRPITQGGALEGSRGLDFGPGDWIIAQLGVTARQLIEEEASLKSVRCLVEQPHQVKPQSQIGGYSRLEPAVWPMQWG